MKTFIHKSELPVFRDVVARALGLQYSDKPLAADSDILEFTIRAVGGLPLIDADLAFLIGREIEARQQLLSAAQVFEAANFQS